MFSKSFFLCAVLALLAPVARAEVFPVAVGQSVQTALDKAGPGDVVRLAPGIHRERVAFKNSGTHGRPVVLEGEPGAILDGSSNVPLNWTPAPDIAPGAYRAPVPFVVYTLTADGKIVTMLREDRVRPGATKKDPEGNLWDYTKLFVVGVGPSKWEGVRGLALHLSKPKELLVRFKDDLNPSQMKMTVAPREAVVKISGQNRCVVRGLELRNAFYGVFIENSLGSVVENCKIGPVDFGVEMVKGADRCTVRFNEVFMNSYAGDDPKRVGAWANWTAHKRGGHYDRIGIEMLRSVGGHEVHDNFIHDHWGGIQDIGEPGQNVGLRVHHNRIFNISDDGLEPNGAEEDCRWHDNLVIRSLTGFRIKAPTRGPLYAYRNIFLDNGEDFRNFGGVELQPAAVYVYHNTSTSRPAFSSNKVFGIGTPNYHYFNNLFYSEYWWRNTSESVLPNWKGDHNVFVRRGESPRYEIAKAIAAGQKLDQNSLWTSGDAGFTNFDGQDLSLLATSPARGKGVNLQKLLQVELPGLPAGDAPDAGALQFGEKFPTLPRRSEDVQAPPAGTWPGVGAEAEALARKAALDATLPVLSNGSFQEGLEGWLRASAPVSQVLEEEENSYLRIAAPARVEISHKVTSLVPGQTYELTVKTRGNTSPDARIIVRNLASQKYLGTLVPATAVTWTAQSLKFVPPAAEVGLELSVRAAGNVDLDEFQVKRAG